MTLRELLSVELHPSVRIRISAQCEDNYYFYIDLSNDTPNIGDPLEDLSSDILDAEVMDICAYQSEIYIDVDISMVYIDRNGGKNND